MYNTNGHGAVSQSDFKCNEKIIQNSTLNTMNKHIFPEKKGLSVNDGGSTKATCRSESLKS